MGSECKERSAMLKIAPLRKKRYPARGARKKQFPINNAVSLESAYTSRESAFVVTGQVMPRQDS
jgi:hypothetical protein